MEDEEALQNKIYTQIQEDLVLDKEDFIKAVKIAIKNKSISFVFLYFFWDIYPLLSLSIVGGYHSPYFYPADIHDYHHSGWDNFGVIGVLDAYQSTLAHRYWNVEYPMDKIIASNNSNNSKNKKDNKNSKKKETVYVIYVIMKMKK